MKHLAAILLAASLIGCGRSSGVDALFSDMATGVPEYQRIERFTRPTDAVKGDYFSLELRQSSAQFNSFLSKLGVAETAALSPAGISHVSVASKASPKYPWFLSVRAQALERGGYRVHVEGQQPYD